MKNTILAIFLILTCSVKSQNIKIENGIFYTIVENGIKQNKKIKFKIDKETIEKIKLTENYKVTLEDKQFLKANKEKRKISSPFVVHLYSIVNNAIMKTTWQLKDKLSFDYLENSFGEIYINDNGDVIVKFYFKSKNGFGNELTSLAKYNDNTNQVEISN